MSFLAPLFLVGALVVGLPILFHLIRRSTREKTVFSSLMFLQASPPRLSRRSRLEHILLLLLRCAAVVLLAFGFARPLWKNIFPATEAAGPARRTVVLLDTSASMRRQNLWAEARDKVEAIVRRAAPVDQLAIFSFDRQLQPVVSFEAWKATPAADRTGLVQSRLAGLKPGWASTHLDTALIRAAEMLVEGEEGRFEGTRQVILISDLQEGSDVRALQGHEWPKGVEVITELVRPRTSNNAGIQLLSEGGDRDYVVDSGGLPVATPASNAVATAAAPAGTRGTRPPGEIRVRISNAADSRREQFQVGWGRTDGTFALKPVDVYVPPGQSRIATLPSPATNAGSDRIVLKGDDEPFDNTVYVVQPEPAKVTVLYFGGDSPGDTGQPLFFLNHALQQTRRQQVRVEARNSSSALDPDALEGAALLVVTEPLPDTEGRVLREAVMRGKTMLFAPSRATASATLSAILGTEVAFTEKRLENYAMLAQIDFRHPLFAPFSDTRFSDFSKLHFWRYRVAAENTLPQSRVLARFDTGDAAMAEIPLGKGRVILWAACWHPADSQLAVSSKFVPMLYALLEYSGATPPAPQQYFVGAEVPLGAELSGLSAPASIRLPDGSSLPLRQDQTNFSETLAPGIYALGGAPPFRFAVNLEAAESRTAALSADELERLGVPTAHATPVALKEADRKIRLQNSEWEARQKLWRWFIVATLTVLGLETWLAGRTARGSYIKEGSA